MKKSILIIVFIGSLSNACDLSSKGEEGCDFQSQIFKQDSPLEISALAPEDFGGSPIDFFLFQDTLAYILAEKPKNKLFILNTNEKKFVGKVDLDPNFIEYPSGIHVISPDSILISDQLVPVIFLISGNGEILDSYNLYRENLWEMPQEGFSNFSFYFGYGKTFVFLPDRNSIVFPLKQLDLWYFVQEKKNFPTFGEYSLVEKEFKGLYGNYPGVYGSDQNHLLPFYLSHPVMEVANERVIISYPLDPNLYIYDLNGTLLDQKCSSISELDLGKPLEYMMDDYDTEGVINYHKSNSYFGSFFYVKSKNKFVRMFLECVKGGDEICKYKKLYALIFDQNLDLESVKELPSEYSSNYFMYQTGFNQGFLSKTSQLTSDDLFSLSDYFIVD
ncbi:hypothetical protein Aoki45_12540 [Algoriphagus sp. oki45]|uniref:hypothetical protein n=1 Tax=Algoriphagus sp. oki45 TaxID=3067294 RepID=UPI0027EF0415|nr:hypothetical protein Aoki45_12540 [Algoriphagus sp. oki45]